MAYMKKKRKNPIAVIMGMTAALFIGAVMFYFVTAEGDFSLTGLFDKLLIGEGEKKRINNSSSTEVNIYSLNNSYDFDVDFEAENVLFGFFTLYYGALGDLGQNELEQLYTYTSDSRIFDEFVHSYLVKMRKSNHIPLTYPACDIEIIYEKVSAGVSGLLEITLSVNFSAAFDGYGGIISTERDMRHFFRLREKTGEWLIDAHEDLSHTGEYFNGILNFLIEEDGFRRSDITLTYMAGYIKKMEKLLNASLYDMYDAAFEKTQPMFDEPYDRAAAAEYAAEWSNPDRTLRNLSAYANFNDNSVNFTSQCISAGGISMDALGEWQWKWYSNKLDESERSGIDRTGYSRSWINGKSFFEYALNNKGFGMKASPVPFEEAEKADVIQCLLPDVYNDEVVYQCLVTGVFDGGLIVTGNSGDVINMPVAALGYGMARVIKIYGYNTSNME